TGAMRAELRHQERAAPHLDRLLRGQRQTTAGAADVEHDEGRAFRAGPRGRRTDGERYRLRDVHASARRPRGLEHAAREWALGADLSQGEIRHGRPRARVLDAEGE